ncbi:MAG: hypothetical protein ACHQM4_07090 [Thermoanaerobaculia bacterium]
MLEKARRLFVFGALSASWHLLASDASAVAKQNRKLAEAAEAILRADYRGDRAELLKLAGSLSSTALSTNAAYREYWTGFAYWRRAMNGFNETPTPPDLSEDLERCAARERAALALDPAFEDARGALLGCLMNQAFLAAQFPQEKRGPVIRELVDVLKAVAPRSEGNPRSLWLIGGHQIFAPPPYGGNTARGLATYRRGLTAARQEALSPTPREPWAPSWGAPELLMSLAYVHTYGANPDLAVARAYADGALAMVPDWHYVRDILVPAIEKLSNAPTPAIERESKKPEGGSP